MPLYFCFTPHGAISGSVKSGIAKEITRLHIEATGAPAALIHVVFQDLSVGSHFLAGKCDHRTSIIIANFRPGTAGDVGPKLRKSVSAAWSRLTGQLEQQVIMTVNDADGAAVTGFVLPEVGDGGCVG
jgi:phenylpyruvate tautomerase PptA (4-oxalocrotonate tautomerase family)